ncbi:hypothetical protein ACPCTO_38165 [Streptomyces olivoreticuli]
MALVSGDLICTAGFALVFAPLLRPGGTATVTAKADLKGCASPNGRHPELRFGVFEASGEAKAHPVSAGPCSGLQTADGTGTITWSPVTAHSQFLWKATASAVNGAITLSATITSGKLKGGTIVAGPVSTRVKPGRPSAGLESLTSELTVVVFG